MITSGPHSYLKHISTPTSQTSALQPIRRRHPYRSVTYNGRGKQPRPSNAVHNERHDLCRALPPPPQHLEELQTINQSHSFPWAPPLPMTLYSFGSEAGVIVFVSLQASPPQSIHCCADRSCPCAVSSSYRCLSPPL